MLRPERDPVRALQAYLIWLAQRLAHDADESLEEAVLRAQRAYGQPDFVVRAQHALEFVVRSGPAALGPEQEAQLRAVLERVHTVLAPIRDVSGRVHH